MRIKIVSDGTFNGLRVVNAETGEEVEGVRGVRFTNYVGQHPMCDLSIIVKDIDLTTDVTGGEAFSLPSWKGFHLRRDKGMDNE